MSIPHARSPVIEDELARRLAVITDPAYVDAARRDLALVDYLLLTVLNVAVVVIMLWYAWG